ncbi:MAG: uroporphyrinogen-III synthase [Halapricum sp.]
MTAPRVAVFRPNDDRIDRAVELLASLHVEPVADPMLAVVPAGTIPRSDADAVVFTSTTGVELLVEAGWTPGDAMVCAIGETTAKALRDAGIRVDVVPDTYTSGGLVEALEGSVDGTLVELARSDHGSQVLIEGLFDAGAYVHETVLYRLVRPDGAGKSTEMAAAGDLDGALFSSSLTVEHFLESAAERGVREAAIDGLEDAVVGVIGPPTAETAESSGIDVDVVPETADFERLTRAVLERIRSN